jgi:hypothetical protein
MIVVLLVKSSLGSSLDWSDVIGFWLGSGWMVSVWLWLVVLDFVVSETWHVTSKVSRRLCSNLSWDQLLVMWLCANPQLIVPFN